jgi:anion-transporting  ArsA/GET3 family ATPase
MELMHARTTQVHLVTVLEEMPVQETIDGIAELERTGLPVGSVLLNLVRPELVSSATRKALESGDLDESVVASALRSVSLPADAAASLLEQARAHVERQKLQREQRTVIGGTGRPLVELPLLGDGVDQAALFELAEVLRDHLGPTPSGGTA